MTGGMTMTETKAIGFDRFEWGAMYSAPNGEPIVGYRIGDDGRVVFHTSSNATFRLPQLIKTRNAENAA
jgi:hypothetical protein